MSWKIRFEGEREKCPEMVPFEMCSILSEIAEKAVKCNEAECPLRIVDDDVEAEKMVAGSE